MIDWVAALNRLYRSEPALHRLDNDPAGFSWIVGDDADGQRAAQVEQEGAGVVAAGTLPADVTVTFAAAKPGHVLGDGH